MEMVGKLFPPLSLSTSSLLDHYRKRERERGRGGRGITGLGVSKRDTAKGE